MAIFLNLKSEQQLNNVMYASKPPIKFDRNVHSKLQASIFSLNPRNLTPIDLPRNVSSAAVVLESEIKETNVSVKINLDGSGVADSSSGIPFLDHMLDALLEAFGDRTDVKQLVRGYVWLAISIWWNISSNHWYIQQNIYAFLWAQLAGKNSHHIIEATFEAFARALRQATEYDPHRLGTVTSSKGVLSRS
ncbi:unnamed protein product [Sphenostylis stenocarpa]|uniref:Imidazoleglycerol-phosphate dehydratase n=1 Tax=Sphenostylis stenocarpa TaxID=92480 RepID=A0AA86W2J0_9FABA|nr:unnamed protein product [Sphenostylis stenocarpa]